MAANKANSRQHYGAYKQADGEWSGIQTFTSYRIAKVQLEFYAAGRGFIINNGGIRYDK